MNNPNDKTSILKDTAVFDFVSGDQTTGSQENFKQLIAGDQSLHQDVDTETALRAALGQVHDDEQSQTAPVSMANFDALLERIDTLEASDVSDQEPAGVISMNKHWKSTLSLAASLALVAVFSIGYFNQLTDSTFETLSNDKAENAIDFPTLVEQGRMAKVVLAGDLSSEEVEAFLKRYQLDAVSSGGKQTVLYVSTKNEIDSDTLQEWRTDRRVDRVDVVSYDSEK